MDKRTLIFVFSLTVTLFLVNNLFDYWNGDQRAQYIEQRQAKNLILREELKAKIEEKTAKKQALPLAEITSDLEGTTPLATGVYTNGSIVALPWTTELPETVYSKGVKYTLTFKSFGEVDLAAYQKNPESNVEIGNLPFFGSHTLQLLDTEGSVVLGEFKDGALELPFKELQQVKRELGEDVKRTKMDDAIVLMQTGGEYLPVAVYSSEADSLVFLEQMVGLNTEIVSKQKSSEKYFVLENDYQQLVFSNIGGALVEINLPFQSDANEKSVVKEIGFDRDIVAHHPNNARFPLNAYLTPGSSPNGPYKEHGLGKIGGYYPLLRRDFIQSGKRRSTRILPEYYAFNTVSKYPELAELTYEVTYFDSQKIVFEAKQKNRKITKTYTLESSVIDAPYIVNLSIAIEGDSKGIWLTSGVPEVEWISNAPAPALKYRVTKKGKSEVNTLKLENEEFMKSPDWVCNSNGFLGLIMDPLSAIDTGIKTQKIPGAIAPSRLLMIDQEHERFTAQNLPGYTTLLPLNAEGGVMNFRIYAGPFEGTTLRKVDNIFTNPDTGENPDYIASRSFHGWFAFISAPISKFLFILMRFFHYVTHSWALSIVLLTVALRMMLYPLNAWSTKSMLKMQQISPEVTRIQERHKNDPKRAQLEIMNLYRESGVNPISGCFPLLIQMPFLIGMFDLLKSAFELRGAGFIPGWIDNLAAPDVLFTWGTPIFFFGTEFHLLPVLLGGVMLMQQRFMSTAPKDVNQMTDQQRQQKAMGNIMAVVFAVMFYNFPAGLNIYWLSSMLLGMLQQWYTTKQMKSKPGVVELQVDKSYTPKKKPKKR